MKNATFGLALALGVLASAPALADDTYVEHNLGKDQSVTFKDDPMTAPGFDPHGPVIRVRPSAIRMLLLRPRTQFVTEMLKSVESL